MVQTWGHPRIRALLGMLQEEVNLKRMEQHMKPSQQITPVGAKTTFVEVWRWGQELERLRARIAPRFARPEPRRRALVYLQGIVSSVERKNGWHLAEHAGEARPDGMQRLLNSATWDADLVRDDLRAYILACLGDPQAVLVIDETSFRKRGKKSVGVSKQLKTTRCWMGNGICSSVESLFPIVDAPIGSRSKK